MRFLAAAVGAMLLTAAPAAAAGPRFGLWDLQTDLAHASRNEYGDVAVRPVAALAHVRGTVVRCGASCRFGNGWLAFAQPSRLRAADVASATVRYSKRRGWTVRLALRARAQARWTEFARNLAGQAKAKGVPDVLVVVAAGEIAAAPFSTQISTARGVVTLTGFSRASAKALQRALS